MNKHLLLLTVIETWILAFSSVGWGHPLDPALLDIRESEGTVVEVLWRLPASQPSNAPISPVFPERCQELSSPTVSENGQSLTSRWRMDCGNLSLVGEQIGVAGLEVRKTDALVRVRLADGRLIQTVLRGSQEFLILPERSGPLDVLGEYLALGFEHILTGLDHLLFVFGLILLVHGWRRLLWTITAFTIGHSITLSLAVLGLVHIPPAPVEVLIALSIFIVAVEITNDTREQVSWVCRFPWAMALVFGFLHGLGFAGALAQVGLPDGDIPLALFSFNLGIESGQVLFVGLMLAVRVALINKWPVVRWRKATELIPAYVIGSLAAMWVFERVWAMA
ncbi:MAG: HupE/UreJ family protein [Methylobacter sp.]